MAEITHPEDALFNAGASYGYYEIVGASSAPAEEAAGTLETSTIDLPWAPRIRQAVRSHTTTAQQR